MKLLMDTLILVSIVGGGIGLGIGSIQAFVTGDINIAVGGAAALGFGTFFGRWFKQNFEAQAPKN